MAITTKPLRWLQSSHCVNLSVAVSKATTIHLLCEQSPKYGIAKMHYVCFSELERNKTLLSFIANQNWDFSDIIIMKVSMMITEINNLRGWKRTWNNSGVTGKQTLSVAMTSMNAWRTNPKGRLRGGYAMTWHSIFIKLIKSWSSQVKSLLD